MDPFAAIMLGGVAALAIALLLLGKYYPGSGADVLDWRPTRSPEVEAQNEIDDLEQMLEAANVRRRRRGEEELTEESVRADVAEALREQDERREAFLVAKEVEQMLEVVNRGRRRRGEPELTEAEYRAAIEAEQQD